MKGNSVHLGIDTSMSWNSVVWMLLFSSFREKAKDWLLFHLQKTYSSSRLRRDTEAASRNVSFWWTKPVIKQSILISRLPSPSLFAGAIKTLWQNHARNFHSSLSYLDIAKRIKTAVRLCFKMEWWLQVTVILLVKMWTEENHIVQYFPRCWGVKIISIPQKQYDSCYAESSILILR